MAPTLNITHIGTATATLEINGVNMLSIIDAILLGHEDHVDNLDDLGHHKKWTVIGTPTKHILGGECTGFIITSDELVRTRMRRTPERILSFRWHGIC
ncbi:uncharacterized protein DSM5745_04366 [Aspergillus mulundensis]|uniref:Metallo-beta-lactamase domain-containing protein n=1 Tax=Aspergillus mulundensis TaxID=1810919 RepID=A0A3D8SCH3_9EURO|nr:hypothetical protein DSM5745_04366 [Aspergillus mulundensis]RDW84040.1 hypothetical protein DSM5745_04366 [Aspergillus mulundensis]